MCGFAGFIDPKRTFNDDRFHAIADAMSNAIIHRGPDDSGCWVDTNHNLALAFRRLAIIETSVAGHQPLVSENHKFAMVFNGEIYNYLELKHQLNHDGCLVESNSDSVILFRAFQFWGVEKTLSVINGMFAIVLWNAQTQQLFLIRDRLGQKPLYYFYDNQTLLFASELKCLLAYPTFKKKLNYTSVSEFLRYAYVPEPLAIYENTYKVKPAEYLVYSVKSGALSSQHYWSLEETVKAKVNNADVSSLSDDIHTKLKRSVAFRMRSDVPFGSFLSGGIDSSLVTSLMQEQSIDPIKTFSIGFKEAQYDESRYARAVARHLGTDHTELFVTTNEAQEVIPLLPAIYDEPFADPSQIPTFLLSKLTRNYVTVALSGDGGDESFAGYNRHFWVPNMWRYIGNKPEVVKRLTKGVIRSLQPEQWNLVMKAVKPVLPSKLHYQNMGDKLYKLLPFLQSTSPLDVYDKLSSFWQQPGDILLENNLNSNIERMTLDLDLVSSMMYHDTKSYLPGDILTKVDRASMAVSLEVRSPFLDHDLVASAWQLPMQMKLHGSQGKLVLKDLLAQYVPRELFERPKMGFGVPVGDWIRGPLRDWAESLLDKSKLDSGELLQSKLIRRYWDEHVRGQRNWQYPLWCVLMLQSWREYYHI